MEAFRKLCFGGFLLTAAASLLVLPQFAASPAQQMPAMDHAAQAADEATPAFHAKPPQDALPPTMEPSLFTDIQTFNAYVLAGRIKKVLYQQPCYCHCDRSQGHGSLLDCYVSRHATGLRCLPEGGLLRLPTDAPGQEPGANPRGNHARGLAKVDTTKYAKSYLPTQHAPAN